MARSSQAVESERWKRRLQISRDATRRLRQEWFDYMLLYTDGDWELSQAQTEGDAISVNLAFSSIKTQLPRLFFNKPKIFSPPLDPDDVDAAKAAEHWLNGLWNMLPLKSETRSCIQDALIFGNGYMKTGYHSRDIAQWDDLKEIAKDAEVSSVALIQENEQLAQADIPVQRFAIEEAPNRFEAIRDQRTEYDPAIKPELPWAKRISPFFFYADPGATSWGGLRWVCHRIVMSLEDARNITVWKKSVREKLMPEKVGLISEIFPSGSFGGDEIRAERIFRQLSERSPFTIINATTNDPSAEEDSDEGLNQVSVWEIWDKKTNEVRVHSDQVDEPLFLDTQPFKHIEDFPIEPLVFNEVTDSIWGMSDFRAAGLQIMELARLRTQALDHVKRCSNKKVIVPQGSFNETEMRKLESSAMGGIVESTRDDIAASMAPVDFGNLSPDLYTMAAIVKKDFEDITGIGEQQRGVSSGSDTASESVILQQNSNLRTGDRQDQVVDWVAAFTGSLWKISTQFVLPGQVVRYMGPKAFGWAKMGREALRPERDILIEAGSTIRKDDEVKKKRITETLNVLIPLLVQGIIQPDIRELLRQFMEAQEIFTDVDAILNPSQETLNKQLDQLAQVQALLRPGGGDPNPGTNQAANLAGGPGQSPFAGGDQGGGGLGDLANAAVQQGNGASLGV